MDALIDFWGNRIGIVTGGGSGVMEQANALARKRGILSGANFLDITDQSMTTDVDFCQVFQATCRHSRQKWFEIASFPIFNIGGLGSLEELGITLCNMKLSILDPVPVILFDTEGNGDYWTGIENKSTKWSNGAGRRPGSRTISLLPTIRKRLPMSIGNGCNCFRSCLKNSYLDNCLSYRLHESQIASKGLRRVFIDNLPPLLQWVSSFLALVPAGRADLPVLLGKLQSIHNTQHFIDVAPYRQIVDDLVLNNSVLVDKQ